ncbi:transposase, partial [Endozoicomonas ascidiicola]|uniref:transposase n=1 Tax=Endozoicomonas ascidiicola TaxID=1698521 RepID=UPI0015608925
LGDANFENYFLLALLLQARSDVVFEKNGSRLIDFRKCDKKLGSKDGLFKLTRPVRPSWMSSELYEQMPEELVIRAVKNKRRTIITTLLDVEKYPRTEIIALYLKRWHVETDINVIKTIMKMDMLRCKSPAMVRKEISINFLVYNLIRSLMGRTAKHVDKDPREISFKAAQDTLVSFLQMLLGTMGESLETKVINMLEIIGQHIVGNRSGRSEPRAVKKRPKPHKKLQHPRSQARRLKRYQGK